MATLQRTGSPKESIRIMRSYVCGGQSPSAGDAEGGPSQEARTSHHREVRINFRYPDTRLAVQPSRELRSHREPEEDYFPPIRFTISLLAACGAGATEAPWWPERTTRSLSARAPFCSPRSFHISP